MTQPILFQPQKCLFRLLIGGQFHDLQIIGLPLAAQLPSITPEGIARVFVLKSATHPREPRTNAGRVSPEKNDSETLLLERRRKRLFISSIPTAPASSRMTTARLLSRDRSIPSISSFLQCPQPQDHPGEEHPPPPPWAHRRTLCGQPISTRMPVHPTLCFCPSRPVRECR